MSPRKPVDVAMDIFKSDMAKRVERSWCLQDKTERRHRLKTIISLVVELENIKKINRCGVSLGEAAIESVIEGDWEDVLQWVDHFKWEGEDEGVTPDEAKLLQDQQKLEEDEARVLGEPIPPRRGLLIRNGPTLAEVWENFRTILLTAQAESHRLVPGARKGN